MEKIISNGFLPDFINCIGINAGIKCNAANFNGNEYRNVTYVVMHYTGNPNDTAKANANYFSGIGRNASAHFLLTIPRFFRAWH